MADRLNDTDPQSPAAMVSRTDPGLGSPPVLVVGPTDPLPPEPEGSNASIEELIDGITGPRPPPSSRRVAADSARAYSAARRAPASRPMPPVEPAVLSPEPAPVGERDALTVPRSFDAVGASPVLLRREERTVYTGRRAMVRNVVAAVFSAALFAAALMGVMRWKERHAPPASPAAAIVLAPLPPSPEVAAPTATIEIVSPPPAEPVSAAPVTAPTPPRATLRAAPLPAIRRGRLAPRSPAAAGSLDDLNREISH